MNDELSDAAVAPDRAPTVGGPREDIAIVGMSCLFAKADGLASYWSNVLDKVDAVGDVPPGRWDARPHLEADPADAGRIRSARGAFLADTFRFDPVKLRVPPSAIRGADPDQFLVLRCVREALADAGCADCPDGQRTEVVIGRTASGGAGSAAFAHRTEGARRASDILAAFDPGATAEELARARDEMLADLPPFGAETVPGVVPNVVAGRIANRFDFGGANYVVDAACATGLVAVELAVRGLLTGAADLAVVGAVHVGTGPALMAMFDGLGALSGDGVCRPFDADGEGTVIGEGVGVLVLKRMADAERCGDRVYAMLKGIGSSSDGRSTALLSPSARGERLAVDRAYAMAGVSTGTVELVEAHGTGTAEGDRVELEVLNDVFVETCSARTVAIGSVKSMIGHTM
ncbi:MAG: polyketide synthase, partial [Gammaproteobacteria bacterium]|nr:polyketide synthase [Gammaproteobacteria bacterium]